SWLDEVTADVHAEKEAGQLNSLGLAQMDKAPLLTLFKAAVINNAPDAITALSRHVYEKIGKSKNRTVPELNKIGASWGIPETAIRNITGRFYGKNPQYFTPEMLLKAAVQLLSYDFHNMLSQKNVSFRDKYFEADGFLSLPPISRCFTFSTRRALSTICMCEYGDETVFIAVCGASTPFERDRLVLEAVHRARAPLPKPLEDFIKTGRSVLTLCGDTYCGERYTKWRIARNIDDPIQKYGDAGYAYSFGKVAPLLAGDSFSIVNSECVLSHVYDEPQQTGKFIDFVLGAHPKKTIACYKAAGVDAVMLANNHAMDFGAAGCRQTRKFFERAGLPPVGTGSNIDEAETPLLLEIGGRRAIVFNAYCYYLENRHKTFRHYCFGANTGAAFGADAADDLSLWQRMRRYRERFPDAFIVFSPHWSTDFNKRHSHLQPIAESAFAAGADLIVGHGPHITIGAERFDGKLCVYSIGNFVFNTTGVDMDASGHSPYGIVARIGFSREKPELRLYPIYAHNLNTFFQPYPVQEKSQYDEFCSSLAGLEIFETKKDELGYYFVVDV
ncbi:MAG: CapA family protein, partial [Oscillospiraceae bacterium]|nr:CapA family protein [Oscillospiraceae bacterium]